MWNAVTSFASKAFTNAGPFLEGMAIQVVEKLGSVIVGQNPQEDLAALKLKEKELDRKKATYEEEFQTKREGFLEEQLDLDAEKESLLREQEDLKDAEAGLENHQKVVTKDYYDTEKQVAKMRKCLLKKLERYEQNNKKLIEIQEETEREYADHRKRLEEAYKDLRQNQSEIIHLLKTLPAIQKAKELQALTDIFRHNCQVFAESPDAMVEKTMIMQDKYSNKLMEVRNVMLGGHFFPGSVKVWADAALLDLHMLGFLTINGKFGHRTVEIAKDLYKGYWNQLKAAHTKHKPVTEGPDQLKAIEHLLVTEFRNFDSRMMSTSSGALPPALGPTEGDVFDSSSNSTFRSAGDQFDRSSSRRHSGAVREKGAGRRPSAPVLVRWEDAGPSRNADRLLTLEKELAALRMERGIRYDCPRSDTRDWSGRRNPSRSSFRSSVVVPSASGSAHHLGRTFESDSRGNQRYSQDPQDCTAKCNHSISKQEFQHNHREPLAIEYHQDFQGSRHHSRDQQQFHEGQHISSGRQETQGMHYHDEVEQERQRTSGRRNARSEQQSSREKYQERPHSPDNHPETSEEGGSSSGEQTRDWSERRNPSRLSFRSSVVVPSASGSAHRLGRTFESDSRGNQRYSQDPQDCTANCNHSISKLEFQHNHREPLAIEYHQDFQGSRHHSRDQQQYHEGQHISSGRQGTRGMHYHDEVEQERQRTSGRRNARSEQQPSREKYQERPHSPDNHPESSEEGGSSSDEQRRDWSERRNPSRSSFRSSVVVPPASGSAHHLGTTLESDTRGKQRYSQDPQDCTAGSKHSRNKRDSQQNRRETQDMEYQQELRGSRYLSRDQQQHHGRQNIPGDKHGHRGTHDHDGGDQERQENRTSRKDRAGQQAGRQTFQERPHSPDDHSQFGREQFF